MKLLFLLMINSLSLAAAELPLKQFDIALARLTTDLSAQPERERRLQLIQNFEKQIKKWKEEKSKESELIYLDLLTVALEEIPKAPLKKESCREARAQLNLEFQDRPGDASKAPDSKKILKVFDALHTCE